MSHRTKEPPGGTGDEEAGREQVERPDIDRRSFLAGSASLMALGTTSLLLGTAKAAGPDQGVDPMRVPGSGASSYGDRSAFETATRLGGGSHSLTPLQDLHGIVTPSSLHFERHHNGVPTINPKRHRLLVHGLVDKPLIFTVEELKQLPSVSRLAFIECAGNSRDGWGDSNDLTVQEIHGLTSTSEWTGVKLSTVLEAVEMQPKASWMLAEGGDAAGLDRSVPLTDEVLNEAMVCYGQNGEALRPEQGYPLRLLLPGFEGNINVKWLRRLKVTADPVMTKDETSKYTDSLPSGKAMQFTFPMGVKSVITSPSGGLKMQGAGLYQISGIAWSGAGRIRRVDVSADGGATWAPAALSAPVLPKALTRFRLAWRWTTGPAVLMSRAVDETGAVQPTRAALLGTHGAAHRYHYHAIQSWGVSPGGEIRNVYA